MGQLPSQEYGKPHDSLWRMLLVFVFDWLYPKTTWWVKYPPYHRALLLPVTQCCWFLLFLLVAGFWSIIGWIVAGYLLTLSVSSPVMNIASVAIVGWWRSQRVTGATSRDSHWNYNAPRWLISCLQRTSFVEGPHKLLHVILHCRVNNYWMVTVVPRPFFLGKHRQAALI